jgi:hypothetical protein
MAVRYAVANGNWSNTATWDGGTLPTSADDVYSNNFTVTINGTFTVLSIRNTANTTPAVTAGGGFTFANGGNLTCSTPTNGLISNSTTYLLTFDLASGNSATLNASCNTVPAVASGRVILVQNTGTFNIVGDYGLNNSATSDGRYTILINASTIINITGNITCSQSSTRTNSTIYINAGNPTINITGNVSGGNQGSFTAATGNAIYCGTTTTLNITGNITTNSNPTIYFPTSGTLNLVGNVTGGTAYPAVYNTTTAATIDVVGITTSGSGYAAIAGLQTTFVKIRGNVVHTDTYAAIYAGRITIDNNVSSWQFKDSTNTTTRTLYTAGVSLGNPATNNVRFGTTYGPALELTGTLRVPSAANVLNGVLVDATTGTLLMTPADFWNYLISSGFTANSIGDRLQNASTVATTGSQISSYNI